MHVRTFYRQRRSASWRSGSSFEEAADYTGISKGTLSRIERGEQFPRSDQCLILAAFYTPDLYRFLGDHQTDAVLYLFDLYPPSVLRCLQLERNCVDCGKALPPEARANRRRHKGGCS